MLFW
jgi:hypothetical protein